MAHLVSFTTARFDGAHEPANPINPIAGHGVLTWLREALLQDGWEVTEPDAEDWGWYMTVSQNQVSYLVGASGEVVDDTPPREWVVQVHRHRSLMDKLTGRNTLTDDDALTRDIESIVRRDESVTQVDVERNAS